MIHRLVYLSGRLFIITFVGLLMIIFFPYNPLTGNNTEVKKVIQAAVPQGWAFFTRDPREEDIEVFFKNNGVWEKDPHTPISNPNNYFGLKRTPRAQSSQMARLVSGVQPQEWQDCKGSIAGCLEDGKNVITVKNTVSFPVLSDTIGIIIHSPVPWAWSSIKSDNSMPAKFILMNVLCGK